MKVVCLFAITDMYLYCISEARTTWRYEEFEAKE